MKPLFGFDLTNDKKNQTFYADKFLTKEVDNEILQRINDATSAIESTIKKASVPSVLMIIQYLAFIYGIIVVGSMLGADVSFSQAFKNAPVMCVTGILSLIPATIIWFYSKMKQKKVYSDANAKVQMEKLEKYADEAFDNLGVPKDCSSLADILLFSFKCKDGNVKITSPTFINHVYRVYRDGYALCIADVGSLYTFPYETFKAIRKVKKAAILSTWNKDEPFNKGEYKKYKIEQTNIGIRSKPYYILEIEKDGETYGIYFPCYELPTFEALTGLTATEEA